MNNSFRMLAQAQRSEAASPRPFLIHCSQWLAHLSGNGDLNLNTSLDVDDDLLDSLGGGEQAEKESNSSVERPPNRIPM